METGGTVQRAGSCMMLRVLRSHGWKSLGALAAENLVLVLTLWTHFLPTCCNNTQSSPQSLWLGVGSKFGPQGGWEQESIYVYH